MRGTLSIDLLIAAKNHGLITNIENATLDNIKDQLQQGHPSIAYINLGNSFFPRGHYIVITGFDDRLQGLYAHSGKTPNMFFSYQSFLKDWAKTENWVLFVTGCHVE